MTYVQFLIFFAQLLPTIKFLIEELDKLTEAKGTGPEKMGMAVDAVRAAFEEARRDGITWDKVEPFVRFALERVLRLSRMGK